MRAGILDPVDVVRAHLDRIVAVDAQIGALSAVRRDEALAEAAALRDRQDRAALPLAGVPVGVKENMAVQGLPTLHGSLATSRVPAAADDELVRRVRAAGAVVIAKTHMPELAIWPITEGHLCNTRNPVQPWRTPGGSSGGSGAAVAAGMATVALGTDGGGSIRIPAACCGIVGVKTTPGLVPLPGDVGAHWYGLSVSGPLARDVEDAALLLSVLANDDQYARPVQPPAPLRVSLTWRHPIVGASADAEHVEAVRTVGRALGDAGHSVRVADPLFTVHPLLFLRCWLVGVADEADAMRLDLNLLEPATRALVQRGRRLRRLHGGKHAHGFAGAAALRQWMESRDVLVAPILAGPPPAIAEWWGQRWEVLLRTAGNWMGFTPPWNVAGCPAVALPVARGRSGIPLAVQLIGPPNTERTLLGVALQVQQALGGRDAHLISA